MHQLFQQSIWLQKGQQLHYFLMKKQKMHHLCSGRTCCRHLCQTKGHLLRMAQLSALSFGGRSCFCRQLLFVPRSPLMPPLLLLLLLPLMRLLLLQFQDLVQKPKHYQSSSIVCCHRLYQTKRRLQLKDKQIHLEQMLGDKYDSFH